MKLHSAIESMTPTRSGSIESRTAKRSILRHFLLLLALTLALPAMRVAAQTKSEPNRAQEKQPKSQASRKPLSQDKEKLEAAQEGAEFLRRRQAWFFKPRAFPLGFIPQGARERALQQKKQMYQQQGQSSPFAAPRGTGFVTPLLTGPTSAWFSIGPQPTSTTQNPPFTSGRVTALAVNPNNANNVYLGGADGGLWITTDGGTTWTALTDNPPTAANIPTVAVGAIAVDPTTCGAAPSGICTTAYVGTGEDNFGGENIYGEGVLNCTITAGPPPTAACTQDSTFHTVSPLDATRGGPMIGALAVNRAAGQNSILLAGVRGRGSAVQSGVWCSADKGSTWKWVLPTALTNGAGDPATDVAFASDGTAWVALGFPFGAAANGIYKSSAPVTSCTITFPQQTLPVASASMGRITLALAPSDNTKIYAAIADATTTSTTLLGVLRSTNATNATPTWTQLTDPLVSADTASNTSFCSGQCFYDMALAVDPANPAVVFAGGSGAHPIIRTTTGTTTATWADVTALGMVPHVDTHAFAFASDGSKVWVGNDGGVWSTGTPAGTISWNNLNGPTGTSTGALNLTQFYPGVSIHPSNAGFAIGGAQDNGLQVDEAWNPSTPAATALTWQDARLPCDGGFTIIDPSIPSTSYGECEYLPNTILLIGVEFAGDGIIGNGFLATAGIDGSDRGSFIPPLVVDKSNSQTLYFGTCRVWQSKDGANTWNAISPDVTTATHPTTCPVPTSATQPTAILNTIAVAPSDSKTIYVGSDEGEVEVTSDGGANWTSIVTTTLPTRAVTQIAVDPTNAAIAYAVFSGFGTCNNSAVTCDGKGHVFKTANGTAGAATTWVDISGTTVGAKLPDISVNAIVIDPDDAAHNTLYVGTDIGAFFTTDGGVTWNPLGAADSMPNAQILSLTLHDPSRTLRAATHGRGVWDLNLGAGPNTPALVVSKLSPFSANAPGSPTTLTVTGTGFTGSSVVMWGTTAKTTTFVSATQLTAPLTAADLSSGAVVQVSVKDGTSTSNSLPFTVLGQPPTITSVSPTSMPVNSPDTTITVTGTNFGTNSRVILNPDTRFIPITTTFVSSTQLTATVPASFMANFGSTNSVGVENPPPGGGVTLTTATVTLPTFTVVAPPPANDNFASAISIAATPFADTKDSSGATTETADPTPACAQDPRIPFVTGRSNTIWYKVIVTGSGTANIDTIGSSYDSVLSVWSGTSQAALTAVACNDDINPGIDTQSQLNGVNLTAGTTYYIMVSSFGQADPNPDAFGGKSVLNFSCVTCTLPGAVTGSFTMSGTNATVTTTAGTTGSTSSGSSTITIVPSGGFNSAVTITCLTGTPGLTCSPLTIPAGSTTGTLTVNVLNPSSSLTAMVMPSERLFHAVGWPASGRSRGWWALSAGTGLAAIVLLVLPGRKRYRAALGLGLICVLSFTLGCNGGGSGGPVATTTKLTVNTAKVPSTSNSFAFTIAVTGGTPNGQVQLNDGAATLGSAVQVSNGSASTTVNNLAVGTHSITAHYLGDAMTQASVSGTLNVTVTGTTTFVITASPAASNGSPTVNITIN